MRAGVTLLNLGNASGEIVLHRALVPTDRGPACAALAETVALIIERYWREVGYDVPTLEVTPAAPPRHPTALAATAPVGGARPQRPGVGGGLLAAVRSDHGALGSAGLAASLQGRIGLRLSAQITQSETATLPFGTAHFRRYPLRLGGYVPLRLGPGQLEPGIGVDLDEISVGLTNVMADRTLGVWVAVYRRVLRQPGAGRRPGLVGLVDASRLRPSPDARRGRRPLSIRRGRVEHGGLE